MPMESCFNRICAFCGKIRRDRALKKLKQVFPEVKRPVLLTLTIENVPVLSKKVLRDLRDWFSKLRRRKLFANVCTGGVYALEITRNVEHGTWHPHLHALIDSGWIDQEELSTAWKQITKGKGYIVDIRRADENSLQEIVKYLTKGSDFVHNPLLVKEFLDATDRTRMLGTFGYFYGFKFEEDQIEFPPCVHCGCTDKDHYVIIKCDVSAREIRSFRYDDRSYLTWQSP